MFRRLFWFFTGAATGVWATAKVNRAMRGLRPDSLAATAADRALQTGARLRLFALDVRAGMAQRETELHDALGLRTQGGPRTPPAPRTSPGVVPGKGIPALPAQDARDARDATEHHRPARRRGATRGRPDAQDVYENRKDEH